MMSPETRNYSTARQPICWNAARDKCRISCPNPGRRQNQSYFPFPNTTTLSTFSENGNWSMGVAFSTL
jgi:hypothetical protein